MCHSSIPSSCSIRNESDVDSPSYPLTDRVNVTVINVLVLPASSSLTRRYAPPTLVLLVTRGRGRGLWAWSWDTLSPTDSPRHWKENPGWVGPAGTPLLTSPYLRLRGGGGGKLEGDPRSDRYWFSAGLPFPPQVRHVCRRGGPVFRPPLLPTGDQCGHPTPRSDGPTCRVQMVTDGPIGIRSSRPCGSLLV